jgi:hypothetical protein
MRRAIPEVLFNAFARLLVTVPLTWLVYASAFAAMHCENLPASSCFVFAAAAPVGYIVMLGLAADGPPPDYPDATVAWSLAIGLALAWALLAFIHERSRNGKAAE